MNLPYYNGTQVAPNVGQSTRYQPFASGHVSSFNGVTESQVQSLIRTPGTFSLFWIRVSSNTSTGWTFDFRINAADGTQTIAVPTSTTGIFRDTANSDAVVDGDEINTQSVGSGGDASVHWQLTGAVFTPSGTEALRFGTTRGTATNPADGVHQMLTGADPGETTTEANAQNLFTVAGTLRNGHREVTSSTTAVTTVFQLRINSADVNLAISVPAATTGDFEDLVNSDAVVDGDLVTWRVNRSGDANTFRMRVGGVDFEPTTSGVLPLLLSFTGASTTASGTTRSHVVNGDGGDNSGTEANFASLAMLDATVSNLNLNVSGADVTGKFRINGADGTQTVTSVGSGFVRDLLNQDEIIAADVINYSTTNGSITSRTFYAMGARFDVAGLPSSRNFLTGSTHTLSDASSDNVIAGVLGTLENSNRVVLLALDGDPHTETAMDGALIVYGDVHLETLPTADPAVAGQLWNNAGTLKVSAG